MQRDEERVGRQRLKAMLDHDRPTDAMDCGRAAELHSADGDAREQPLPNWGAPPGGGSRGRGRRGGRRLPSSPGNAHSGPGEQVLPRLKDQSHGVTGSQL